jgi:farnesyl-diphosphate farnesyltransferase
MTLAVAPSVVQADRITRTLLPRVSRTFGLGIKLLPARLELPVRLAYLLCRIADTVEDDLSIDAPRKVQLLEEFATCFDDAELADTYGRTVSELTANDGCLALVTSSADVFALYRLLDPATQSILRRWICEMAGGMQAFIRRYPGGIRIADIAEFRYYCFYVAGTAGHLLTELWHQHSNSVDGRTYARLVKDCESFGEALQTVNILKDIAWDAERENAIYVPADLLGAAGSNHAGILDAGRRAENRAALEPLLVMAKDDLERALRYIENIPLSALRVRLFCVLPLLFAVATVREIEQSQAMLVPGGSVKISRAEVRNIMVAATTSTLTNASLRWLVARIRQRPFAFGLG